MDSKSRVLFWLLSASRGASTRRKILFLLNKKPYNIRKLSLELNLDYKSVKGHIDLLNKYEILDAVGGKYGRVYFISPQWEDNEFLKKILFKGGGV
ncbi:MAG: ArsR family transcriptional regulator [Candidatus Anstonellaceae archaeon]